MFRPAFVALFNWSRRRDPLALLTTAFHCFTNESFLGKRASLFRSVLETSLSSPH